MRSSCLLKLALAVSQTFLVFDDFGRYEGVLKAVPLLELSDVFLTIRGRDEVPFSSCS